MTATDETTQQPAEVEKLRQQQRDQNLVLQSDESDAGQALRAAAQADNRDEVNRLLNTGANINGSDVGHRTAVTCAAERGLIAMLRLLLQRGAFADTPSYYVASPLLNAVENNHLEAARLLLENGADPNRNQGYGLYNPIMLAVKNGNAPMLLMLLEQGANPATLGTEYRSALLEAATQGRTDLIEILWAALTDVNAVGDTLFQTPLLSASAHCNDLVTMRRLLDRGADLEKRDYFEKTPLAHAAEWAATDAVRMLLETGANVEARDRGQSTPLLLASAAFGVNQSDQVETLRLLIAAGANIAATDQWNYTALHCAARTGNAACVETLLDAGADIAAIATNDCASGHTPLIEAAQSWRGDAVLSLLLARGANLEGAGKRGFTPLMATMKYNREAAAKILLDAEADPNARDWRGKTALMYATQHGRKNMMHLLIARGSDVNATDKQGKSVLDYATKGKKTRATLVAILEKAGANRVAKAC